MSAKRRIKSLEKRVRILKGRECTHAFTLVVDGEIVKNDPPCSCGGERVKIVVEYV